MNIIDCSLRLIDILQTDDKESFDKELGALQITPSVNNAEWQSVPISRGRRQRFTLNEIPDELKFVESIYVNLMQYQNFSSGIMITLEAKLTSESTEVFANRNYEENKNILEQYNKKIWNFWREKIKSTILANSELTKFEPIVINNLRFNADNYSEISNDALEANKDKNKLKSTILILDKYGVNTLGLISVLYATDKEFSILTQNRAVYRVDSFDYTGISLFDFKLTTWEGLGTSMAMPAILSLLHFLFWLRIRKQQISDWKNKIDKLAKSIREFEGKFLEPNIQKLKLSIFEQKGLFQTEYASFMDERRFISAIANQQIEQKNSIYFGEQLIQTQTTEQLPSHDGLLVNISNDIINLAENLKEEYDVIKEQYKILGEELTEILNFANVQANLQLASESQKTQKSIARQGKIMVLFTFALFLLTSILAYYTIHQVIIDNFPPSITIDGGEMKIYGSFYPWYDHQPEIRVGAATNHFLNFTITNVAFERGSTLANCYFTTKPNNVKLWNSPYTIVGTNGALESLRPFINMDFSVNSTYWNNLYTRENKVPSVVGTLIFDIDVADIQDKAKPHLHQQAYMNLIANLSSTQQANCR